MFNVFSKKGKETLDLKSLTLEIPHYVSLLILNTKTSKMTQGERLLTCIQEGPGSHLGRNTDCANQDLFLVFLIPSAPVPG
jgi:hypothetical protein